MALMHVDFFSDVLGMCMNMDVILPQQTHGQIGMEGTDAGGQYKTVYLLHGMSDDHTIWQRRTSIERYASTLGIAVVMPTTHLGFYTDTVYGMRYWTFISEELPAVCREFFPRMSAKREDTLAAGLSMGRVRRMEAGAAGRRYVRRGGIPVGGFGYRGGLPEEQRSGAAAAVCVDFRKRGRTEGLGQRNHDAGG